MKTQQPLQNGASQPNDSSWFCGNKDLMEDLSCTVQPLQEHVNQIVQNECVLSQDKEPGCSLDKSV